jgi:hypothetical protein
MYSLDKPPHTMSKLADSIEAAKILRQIIIFIIIIITMEISIVQSRLPNK